MKILNKFLTVSAAAFLFMLLAPHKSMAQGYVSNQEFYDNLQNYGTWIQDDQYGNVWVPDVDDDFRPYATQGHWVQTDYGTTWVSDYPWGWATFHYGRWRYDDYYGWEWIPGHEWAPAWVSWRHGGGYYGWAPLQPGITISISFGGGYHVPDNYWVCAPQAYINRPDINRYYVPSYRSTTIIRQTTYINNTYVYNNRTYITGPRPRDIEQVTHQRVAVYHVGNADRPGTARVSNNVINIYHPEIKVTPNARPARAVDAKAYRAANPNAGVGHAGGNVNMHANAAKLAAVARSNNPKVVHVNPTPAHPAAPGNPRNVETAAPRKPNTQPANTHPAMAEGHKNVGTVNHEQQPAAENKNPHKVAPAVMPPADHHDPTVRQSQPAAQQKQQADQAAKQQQQQARQQVQQQKQQAQQAAQKQQQDAQQKAQAQQQARQQAQQQAKAQAQQAQQQARQQAQQQQKQQQQAAQQARQQAQKQQQQQAQKAAKRPAQNQRKPDDQKPPEKQ